MYKYENLCTSMDKDGEHTILANFVAKIDKETRYNDGKTQKTVLTISGENANGPLPPIEIEADKFPALSWVMPNWGVQCVIQPGQSIKEHLRTAIQLSSKPIQETIYTHTGWTKCDGGYMYLHNDGAIRKTGHDSSVRIQLPNELRNYRFPSDKQWKDGAHSTLLLAHLPPHDVGWPAVAATLAPLHGPADFAIHISGRTGTFKSEYSSLLQAHYGPDMDARSLPGSWSSTPNALEAQAWRTANAIFVIDDFIPVGPSYKIRSLQQAADQIIRGQGNQSGRARLTDTSDHQSTMYPRGLIVSTGEDTPEGHSCRARMMILELTPGDIDAKNLTACQGERHQYAAGVAAYIKAIAKDYPAVRQQIKDATNKIRDQHLDVGHTRTPSTIGRLIASVTHWLDWLREERVIGEKKHRSLKRAAEEAILEAGRKQSPYLLSADPCEAFCEALRTVLQGHAGHLRTKNGGIPTDPTAVGWTEESAAGEMPTFKAHGKCIGWIDWDRGELYVEATAGYNEVKKHAFGAIQLTKPTMLKRLKENGNLTRVDDNRQRNSIRMTCEGHSRQVLAMPIAHTLQTQEKP